MGVLSNIGTAEVVERGTFFTMGFRGHCKVHKTLLRQTRNSGECFIVEFEVLTSNMTDNHPIGSKATWIQKDNDSAAGAILAWAAACCGVDPHDKPAVKELQEGLQGVLETAVNPMTPENDFLGSIVDVEAKGIKKRDGGDFTLHIWHPSDFED